MDQTKPGYKTTEFWLGLAAMMIGALVGSGVLTDAPNIVVQIVGIISTVLAALGYGTGRMLTKNAQAKANAITAAAKAQPGN